MWASPDVKTQNHTASVAPTLQGAAALSFVHSEKVCSGNPVVDDGVYQII